MHPLRNFRFHLHFVAGTNVVPSRGASRFADKFAAEWETCVEFLAGDLSVAPFRWPHGRLRGISAHAETPCRQSRTRARIDNPI